jgi:hypothetical protein
MELDDEPNDKHNTSLSESEEEIIPKIITKNSNETQINKN